ncbi:unnamed protein product [Cuscuta epithymum]|uniref:Uncharacterized protein n=1 Tax=Cuscuta epithymum TaxID=186058 RepID=A0AAV0DYX2_9ASTE|nr:unnamed protein product [Cuscuta epithymum]
MAAIKFSRLTRSLNPTFNVRSSIACLSRNYHVTRSHSTQDHLASHRQCNWGSYLSRPSLSSYPLRSVSLVGINPIWSVRLYSSSVGSQGTPSVGSDSAISGASMGSGGSDGSEWILKAKEAFQSLGSVMSYTGEKAREASSDLTPYIQQIVDANPYLRDVIAPISGTLVCTLLAWLVMPRFLRRFHKISTEGPATLFSETSLLKPVPYEKSIWSALEDPIRYLITFMAFTQIAAMVAPTSVASQYILPAWKSATILSSVWFLQRWKTNVISRSLALKSFEAGDRDRLLTLEKVSSVGLFAIGLMGLAEACGGTSAIYSDCGWCRRSGYCFCCSRCHWKCSKWTIITVFTTFFYWRYNKSWICGRSSCRDGADSNVLVDRREVPSYCSKFLVY